MNEPGSLFQATSGPWVVKRKGNRASAIVSNFGLSVCTLPWQKHDYATPRAEADAALIAASPDMLEALNFVQKWMVLRKDRGDTFPTQLEKAIYEAIAKAEGRE